MTHQVRAADGRLISNSFNEIFQEEPMKGHETSDVDKFEMLYFEVLR